MTTECIVHCSNRSKREVARFQRTQSGRRQVVRGPAVLEVFTESVSRLFVSFDSADLLKHLGTRSVQKHHRLLLLEPAGRQMQARTTMLAGFFRTVVTANGGLRFVPIDELAEILAADNASNLAIAAGYDPLLDSVYLIRGNLDRLIVPAGHFQATASGPKPAFDQVGVVDYGNALKLGDYEASMDALLYEHDAEFRRELRRRRIDNDTSFGASIRRLRMHRRLARTDIPDVSERQIARIERGEIVRPRRGTLAALAAALDVAMEDLGDY